MSGLDRGQYPYIEKKRVTEASTKTQNTQDLKEEVLSQGNIRNSAAEYER